MEKKKPKFHKVYIAPSYWEDKGKKKIEYAPIKEESFKYKHVGYVCQLSDLCRN